MKQKKRGTTLIELAIVLAILMIIITLGLSLMSGGGNTNSEAFAIMFPEQSKALSLQKIANQQERNGR